MSGNLPQALSNLGYQLQSGESLSKAIANGLSYYQDNIVALAGGAAPTLPPQPGQAASSLTIGVNRVVTANANDSVYLPLSVPGATVKVLNSTANAIQLFSNPASALQSSVLDTINGSPGNAGISIASGKAAELTCYSYGAWLGAVALV